MPSPFPGMDPYLEDPDIWPDFHTTFFAEIRAELHRRLPKRYVARLDRHVWMEEPKQTRPRLKVAAGSTANRDNLFLATAPLLTTMSEVRMTGNCYLKIRETTSNRIVTIVAMLSPSAKRPGAERVAYLWNRNQYFVQRINVVEFDLLRDGLRAPFGEPTPPQAPYYAIVARGVEFPRLGIWPLPLRDVLPDLPIPLGPHDDPISLPLQKCISAAYEMGSYATEIDYSKPPKPQFEFEDAAWVEEKMSREVRR